MKKKILIIDDHDDFRGTVKEYLKRHKLGVDLFEASTGEMGVAKASFIKPDLVIMDINLPQINGFEAIGQIREDHPKCDIIILTVFDVGVFKKTADKMMAKAFIGKNEVYEKLLPAVKKCLEVA
jgi:DNA-binding NarL/FixJ family response regulator